MFSNMVTKSGRNFTPKIPMEGRERTIPSEQPSLTIPRSPLSKTKISLVLSTTLNCIYIEEDGSETASPFTVLRAVGYACLGIFRESVL